VSRGAGYYKARAPHLFFSPTARFAQFFATPCGRSKQLLRFLHYKAQFVCSSALKRWPIWSTEGPCCPPPACELIIFSLPEQQTGRAKHHAGHSGRDGGMHKLIHTLLCYLVGWLVLLVIN